MGDEGAYDDLELTLAGGRCRSPSPRWSRSTASRTAAVPDRALLRAVPGPCPWTIGTDATVAQSGISLNQIVTGGSRSINYKVTGTAQQAGKVTGTLGMSYFDSQYDIWSNTITFVNCSGAQSFEAVPAG